MRHEIERYLRDLVAAADAVLRDGLVGAYAAGSVALDAFDPERSDIDVALVVGRPLGMSAKQQLVEVLRHDSLPCPARGLELVVYQRWVALSGTVAPGFELELNSGPRMDFRVTMRPKDRPPEDGLFWYGLDRDILHEHGLTLAGPPATQVFAEVEANGLRGLLLESLAWWHRRTPTHTSPTPGAEDAVLSACRALLRHRRGAWFAKVEAAQSLLAEGYGPREVLRQSIDARAGGLPPSGAHARAFQEQVMNELAGALP